MMIALTPTYTLKVEVRDTESTLQGVGMVAAQGVVNLPRHRYYAPSSGQSGCDQVLAAVRDALAKAGITNITVTLERFEHRG